MRHLNLALLALLIMLTTRVARGADYVIAISIDGMAAVYVQPMMADDLLPNLQRLREEGASTLNARTDADYTITLPNHTDMVTGRGTAGPRGHHWTRNRDPKKGQTLATNRGGYVASMFDVAHDHGLRTGLWSGKSKFSIYDVSYNAENGAPDEVGEDNGRDKIDYAMLPGRMMTGPLTADFIARMAQDPAQLAFVHYRDPDSYGHGQNWDSIAYRKALMRVDQSIGMILAMVANHPKLAGHTAVIVTADHGGRRHGHGDSEDLRDYTIPFIVWGPGVDHGDLYKMNPKSRENPGIDQVPFAAPGQPIRNGDLGNLALDLLGLNAIPGSTINAQQDLSVSAPAKKP